MREDLDHFQQLLERTISLREQLRGAHPRLEEGIDAMVGNGQVRHQTTKPAHNGDKTELGDSLLSWSAETVCRNWFSFVQPLHCRVRMLGRRSRRCQMSGSFAGQFWGSSDARPLSR